PTFPLQYVNGNTCDPFSAVTDFQPLPVHPAAQEITMFQVQPWNPRPHIFINDRGGKSAAPRSVADNRALEHELTHWSLRQTAAQGGRYNAAEHLQCPQQGPCNIPYIMKNKVPHPLQWYDVPGGPCESWEVYQKAATWDQP